MGCCVGLKNDIFKDKELIENLGPNEIKNILEKNGDIIKDSSKSQNRKPSSQSCETNAESVVNEKKRKNSKNFHNEIIKDITKYLKLIAIEEIKNMRIFFVLK